MDIEKCFEEVEMDKAIGSKLIKFDEQLGMAIYMVEIEVGVTLPPHYHNEQHEFYLIMSGSGRMQLGVVVDETLCWREELSMSEGAFIKVEAGQVHSITNNGIKPLRVLFHTPLSHMSDDRYFV